MTESEKRALWQLLSPQERQFFTDLRQTFGEYTVEPLPAKDDD